MEYLFGLLFPFQSPFFLRVELGFLLLFAFAFILLSLISHFHFSLVESEIRRQGRKFPTCIRLRPDDWQSPRNAVESVPGLIENFKELISEFPENQDICSMDSVIAMSPHIRRVRQIHGLPGNSRGNADIGGAGKLIEHEICDIGS